MDDEAARKLLEKEGYTKVYTWKDKPLKIYASHFHRADTKLIIQRGAMEVTIAGVAKNYSQEDVVEIPCRAIHSARIGKEGCRYLVGEHNIF